MSTIKVAMSLQGFVAANKRPACRNCISGDEQRADRSPPFDTVSWYCRKGGFYVTAQAVCKQYQATERHKSLAGSTEEPSV